MQGKVYGKKYLVSRIYLLVKGPAMQKTAWIFIVLGFLLAGSLFWVLRPEIPEVVGNEVTSEAVPQAERPAVVQITLQAGHRVAGPEVVKVSQGEQVILRFVSDQPAELHLHGYDRHLHLDAGVPAEMSLLAEHSGRFEYELHGQGAGHHAVLGVIEVMPQ